MGNRSKRKLFIFIFIGLICRTVFILCYFFYIKKDINDMNEIIMYGIQRLFEGKNPYSVEYTITIWWVPDHVYSWDMYLGYPPFSLIIYAPVILFPQLTGSMELIIIIFIENVIFDLLIFIIIWDDKEKYHQIIALVYWLLPLFYFLEYAIFFSSIFFFVIASLYYIEKPFLSGLFITIAIFSYHLYIFIYPILFLYQLREFRLDLSHQTFKEKIKIFLKEIQSKKKDIGKFLGGSAIPSVIFIVFVIWDYESLKYCLFDASAQRFRINYFQYSLIIIALISCVWIMFFPTKIKAYRYLNINLLIFYFFEAIILNISMIVYTIHNFKPHYFLLMVPFGIMVFINPPFVKNSEIPTYLKNSKEED